MHPGRAARRAEHRGIGGPRVGGRRAAAWGHMTRLAKSSVDCKIHAADKGGKLGGGELAATATATLGGAAQEARCVTPGSAPPSFVAVLCSYIAPCDSLPAPRPPGVTAQIAA